MTIESTQNCDNKDEKFALLKLLTLGKKDALAGKGLSADDFLKELDAMDEPHKVAPPTSAAAVFDLLASLPADFMHESRDDSPPQTRESL